MTQSIGSVWQKCDLHLHTPASKCFKDQKVTPEEWVQKCIDMDLDCVAITDHNTGEWVDKVKKVADTTDLTVFPGVELTCSDAKVHLLILFDKDANTQTIEDFLITVEIDRKEFGEQIAHSNLSVKDVIEIAKAKNLLVIPAHIDEYNGLKEVGHGVQENLFTNRGIDGVQVIHQTFTLNDKDYSKLDQKDILQKQKEYYDLSDNVLSLTDIKNSRNVVRNARHENKALLTFSDNPHAKNEPKHGLWGIGRRYTWLKMDKEITLEGLRQAMMLPDTRVWNDFNDDDLILPPSTWITKIKVSGVTVLDNDKLFEVNFNPQMNSIIGGRGTGKSSIIRFIIGALNKQTEFETLVNIKKDFDAFFKKEDKLEGVLTDKTKIEIYLTRNHDKFRIIYNSSNSMDKLKISREKDGDFVEEEVENIDDLFDVEIFSQKQIYEIANKPNALRTLLDNNSSDVTRIRRELEMKKREYFSCNSEIRSLESRTVDKSKLKIQYKDIQDKLKTFNDLPDKALNFREINQCVDSAKDEVVRFKEHMKSSQKDDHQELDCVNGLNEPEIKKILEEKILQLGKLKERFRLLPKQVWELEKSLGKEIHDSSWNKEYQEITKQIQSISEEFGKTQNGSSNPEELIKQEQSIANKLRQIKEIEKEIETSKKKAKNIKSEYYKKRKALTEARKEYVESFMESTNEIRIRIDGYQDNDNFEVQLRHILSANNSFDEDFTKIVEELPRDKRQPAQLDYVKSIKKDFYNLMGDKYEGGLSGRFKNKIDQVTDESWEKLDLLLPEDKIVIEYKTDAGEYISIETGSAGQKTAAILTLILSYRDTPLILDQPEDDLDNSLIYSLVTKQLRETKKNRQIIVVTHNANIPVNGDSELIIVMDSKSKFLKTHSIGSLEQERIKEKICLIMEGGEQAFEMRASRYNLD